MKEKWKQLHWFWIFMLVFSLLGTIKMILIGSDVDEQYAVAMAYRMVRGDRMFMEMWEPHQTSGFLAAIFVKLFLMVTGSVDYLVIYLRVVGVLIQFAISVCLYHAMRKVFHRDVALCMAFFLYNTISKNTPMPEFTNMLLWFSVMTFLCLMRFVLDAEHSKLWLAAAGISSSLLVLSYPTSIVAVLPVLAGIFCTSGKKRMANCAVYMGTCAGCGIAYVLYFLGHMSVGTFLYGLRQMSTDKAHSASLLDKFSGYGRDLMVVAPHLLAAGGVAVILWALMKCAAKLKNCSFLVCLLLGACLEQGYVWLFRNHYLKFPCIFYFVLMAVAVFRYQKRSRFDIFKEDAAYRAMFWFGSVTALFLWLAGLLASNTHLYETVEYMMVGFIVSIGYLGYEHRQSCLWWKLIVLVLLGICLLRRSIFVPYMYGTDSVWVIKQKAVSGPLAGVYCRWSEGESYNVMSYIMEKYVPEGSKVLAVTTENLCYLQGEHLISHFSTISAPSFDEQLYTYWEQYPEKYPEYIAWDEAISGLFAPGEAMKERLKSDFNLVAEEDGWQIYRDKKFSP